MCWLIIFEVHLSGIEFNARWAGCYRPDFPCKQAAGAGGELQPSQISNKAEGEQGQGALEDQCVAFVMLGFMLPTCQVNLKLRENEIFPVVVREKKIQDQLIHAKIHSVHFE